MLSIFFGLSPQHEVEHADLAHQDAQGQVFHLQEILSSQADTLGLGELGLELRGRGDVSGRPVEEERVVDRLGCGDVADDRR